MHRSLLVSLNATIEPSQGFSVYGLGRGILGMVVLIAIAYLFSNNKKAIN